MSIPMSNVVAVKVLSLDPWMKSTSSKLFEDTVHSEFTPYTPTETVFSRPGLYLDRIKNVSWFERADGTAYTYPIEWFKRDLELKEAALFTKEQEAALRQIENVGLASSEQKKMLRSRNEHNTIIACQRSAKRIKLRIKKKMKNKK